MRNSRKKFQKVLRGQRGVALLAALILMAVVGVMGASVLMATSTEIAISGNYRRAIEAFYLAEAAIEEARARLKGSSLNNHAFIGDPVTEYNPQWSAYVLTDTDWNPSDDDAYSTRFTNYIPTRSMLTNTAILANSLKIDLPYWVKIRHKTEYDAERAGHRSATPHYLDADGSLKTHSKTNRGHVVLYGYPAPTSVEPTQFTTTGTTTAFPTEILTAHGEVKGGSTIIEVEVIHHPGPRSLAAIYARNGVSLTPSLSAISGLDHCGAVGPKAPVYTLAPSSTTGSAIFQGNPSSPEQGPLDIDVSLMIDSLKKGGVRLTGDQISVMLGDKSAPETFYANLTDLPKTVVLTIQNVAGYGILLVEGNLLIKGPLHWEGLILSSGTLTLDGSSGPIQVWGGVWSNQIQHVAGDLTITYDSCEITTALMNRPLTVTQWRQVL